MEDWSCTAERKTGADLNGSPSNSKSDCQLLSSIMEGISQEIFLRLAAKSLIKCKLLSKNWHNFITYNPGFRRNYLSRTTGARGYLMLGLFFSGTFDWKVPAQLKFLPTSTQGRKNGLCMLPGQKGVARRKRKDKAACPLDYKLGFLGRRESIDVLGCCNGFLLCCLQHTYPKHYFVCNPINKQWVALPRPHSPRRFCHIHGFTHSCLDKAAHCYKVVRCLTRPRTLFTTLTIEIFSTELPEWKLWNLICPFSFRLRRTATPTAVIGEQGLIYLPALVERHHCFIIFDPRKNCVELMEIPPKKNNIGYIEDMFGQSGGNIIFVQHEHRHGGDEVNIWFLQEKDDSRRREWSLHCKASLDITMEKCPEFVPSRYDEFLFSLIAIHPLNPNFVFASIGDKIFLLDLDTSSLELICDANVFFWPHINAYTYGLFGSHLFLDLEKKEID